MSTAYSSTSLTRPIRPMMRSHDLIALIFIDFDQWYTDIPLYIAFHRDVCDFIDIFAT